MIALADTAYWTGARLFVIVAFAIPPALWLLEREIRRRAPKALDDEEPLHGRDYYLGFVVGQHLRVHDLEGMIRHLRRESYHIQVYKDKGGEKTFVARNLPPTRGTGHDLESGLLAGALFRALRTRFEVDEERCAARGDGYCRFVAVKG